MPKCEHAKFADPPEQRHPTQPAEVAEPRTDEKGDAQHAGDDGTEPALADVAAPDRNDRERRQKDAAAQPQHRECTGHRTVDAWLLESRQQTTERIEPRRSDAQNPRSAGVEGRPTADESAGSEIADGDRDSPDHDVRARCGRVVAPLLDGMTDKSDVLAHPVFDHLLLLLIGYFVMQSTLSRGIPQTKNLHRTAIVVPVAPVATTD